MLKFLMFAAVAAAVGCGGDDGAPGPFDPGPCDQGWGSAVDVQPMACDHECETVPSNFKGSAGDASMCFASRPDGDTYSCEWSFTTGTGLTGCCRAYDGQRPGDPGTVVYYECD
jgi:hypothetical protein